MSETCVYGIAAASGAPGESDLVAALTPFEGKSIDPESIYKLCRKELETNFIPSFLQVVDEIPKSIADLKIYDFIIILDEYMSKPDDDEKLRSVIGIEFIDYSIPDIIDVWIGEDYERESWIEHNFPYKEMFITL